MPLLALAQATAAEAIMHFLDRMTPAAAVNTRPAGRVFTAAAFQPITVFPNRVS
jgi:hypothetical protein